MRSDTDRRWYSVARAARPLALTLGGGAMLTLASAGIATAGTPGTGDATATGNQSGTKAGQTLTMTDGGIATVDGRVGNDGQARSHTGTNTAIGNDDENEDDDSVDGKVNIDEVANESDGEATVQTGWAWSGGNQSQTDLTQSGNVTGGQSLVVLTQGATVLNAGLGIADTGTNDGGPVVSGNAWALGNWSDNEIIQVADATSGASLLVLGQVAEIANRQLDGPNSAIAHTGDNIGDVTSGDATAKGNESRDRTGQGMVADGDTLAAAVAQQISRNRNSGDADANTGWNEGDAGEGDDEDDLEQTPDPEDLDTWLDLFDIDF